MHSRGGKKMFGFSNIDRILAQTIEQNGTSKADDTDFVMRCYNEVVDFILSYNNTFS